MKIGPSALGLVLACTGAIARAEGTDETGRSFAAAASFGGQLALGKVSESAEGATLDSAWYSRYQAERRGVGPTLELGVQSRSSRNAFGAMLALSWLRGKTTITSGDRRAIVSDAHRVVLLSATGDWRVDQSSPFHGGGALGLGAFAGTEPAHGSAALLAGSLSFGADWTLGGTNIAIGPRIRVDAAVGFGGGMLGASLLLDVTYWNR